MSSIRRGKGINVLSETSAKSMRSDNHGKDSPAPWGKALPQKVLRQPFTTISALASTIFLPGLALAIDYLAT